jgi:S1-C subfamily serine protease
MRHVTTKMILTCVALIVSASGAWALPKCPDDVDVVWSNCFGSRTDEDGIKYIGEWKNNYRHGKGTEIDSDGNKYVGAFKDDQKNGWGTFIWADGDKYVGGFRNNIKNGLGTYTFANGEEYVGEFKDDMRNGRGIYAYTDGTIEEGVWKNDSFAYDEQTSHYKNLSLLQKSFTELAISKRKQVQANLLKVGLYNSSINGFFGRATAAALEAYNNKHFSGNDLSVSDNVSTLLSAVLLLNVEQIPSTATDDEERTNETYNVASGTGFYVSSQGHIITNSHVIDGCLDVKVHANGRILQTVKLATDAKNDLALLQASEPTNHFFALSDASPYPLQDITVAGFPFGDRVSSTLKFTKGIVSSIAGIGNNYSEIQIDAALQPGNSGGPIIDEYGNVIAVAVAKLDIKTIMEDYGVAPENTNFGIKVSAVRNLMEGNSVEFKAPNTQIMSKQDLSRNATNGTVYLTCWMTLAQIEQLRTKKVMFESFE